MCGDGLDLREKVSRHFGDLQTQKILELRQCDQHRNAVGKAHHDAHRHIAHKGTHFEKAEQEQQHTGAGGGNQQIGQAVLLDDAVNNNNEGAGRPADLHRRAAQQGNQSARDDGCPDAGLRGEATGNGKGHRQRQGHNADGQTGTQVLDEALSRVAAQRGKNAGPKGRQISGQMHQKKSRTAHVCRVHPPTVGWSDHVPLVKVRPAFPVSETAPAILSR